MSLWACNADITLLKNKVDVCITLFEHKLKKANNENVIL
ncbi:MAG: hypothetical protein K0R09_2790 [Clostridiales bacterium]|nr:hypothetical protein [Clostridiales bacterium]